jgi:hypothetical protein
LCAGGGKRRANTSASRNAIGVQVAAELRLFERQLLPLAEAARRRPEGAADVGLDAVVVKPTGNVRKRGGLLPAAQAGHALNFADLFLPLIHRPGKKAA